jgi:putative kinase
VPIEQIDSYPWFLNKPLDLEVNDHLVRTRVHANQWVDHWRPLLGKLQDMWLAAQPRRLTIAGAPGSGKSVLAEQLHWMVERGLFHKNAHSVALPMDGFHYPNAYLEQHVRKLPDGTEIPLSTVKGQPDTIDIANYRKHLKMAVGRPDHMDWPGYSRFTHDVVPNKFRVHASANVVIVEGNYVLVNRGAFAGLPDIFDLRIYVDGPAPKIMANLMERHIAGGKSVEDAKAWVKRIDLPNARIAESSKMQADLVIERDHEENMSAVTWRGEEKGAASDSVKPKNDEGTKPQETLPS